MTSSSRSIEAPPILLASGSPRRRYLLESAGFEVVCEPQDVDESWPGGEVEAGVVQLALRKLGQCREKTLLVVAADTVVVLGESPLGKPRDRDEAIRILSALSGKKHRVLTGVAVRKGKNEHCFAVSTEVTFRKLSLLEIEKYVDLGECFDKAGAYGIQGHGSSLVDTVEGSYTNVVGLPLKPVDWERKPSS